MSKNKIKDEDINIQEWEIWHTYTSYIQAKNLDLKYVAKYLVKSGIASLAFHKDGSTYWMEKEGLCEGITHIFYQSDKDFNIYELKSESENDVDLGEYAREALDMACWFRSREKRFFSHDLLLPPSYIRVYLEQCIFYSESTKSRIKIYPIILLYESGVVIVEFRTLSPKQDITVNQFIESHVNLFNQTFDKLVVPPSLAKIAVEFLHLLDSKLNIFQRFDHIRRIRFHNDVITDLTEIDDDGDFRFKLAPLSTSGKDSESESLSSFFLILLNTIAGIISKPRSILGFLIWGHKELPKLGTYWTGKPHIYLIKFDDQKETSNENEESHGLVFGRIIMRVESPEPEAALNNLPNDSRVFPDYSAYISSQASLWVWSLHGHKQRGSFANKNHADLIYAPQSTIELLEYLYMLHRRLLNTIEAYYNADQIIQIRKDLVNLDQAMEEVSKFGEITSLLKQGWDAMGLPSLKYRINESLKIQESMSLIYETRLRMKSNRAIAILFGFLAFPPFAYQVLKPLWLYADFPRPENESAFSLILLAVSFSVLSALVIALLKFFRI